MGCVSCESTKLSQGNPSPPFALYTISPLKGGAGLSDFQVGRVIGAGSPLRNDDTTIPGTRIEPKSDKESPEVETTKEKEVEITKEKEVEFVDKIVEITSDAASPEQENTNDQEVELAKETPVVEITNVVIPVNVDDDEEEIIDEVYELKRKEKGKIVEETRNSPIPTPTRSPRNLSNLGRYGYLFAHLRARFMPRKSSDQLADDLHDVMVETLPFMVKEHVREQVKKQVPEQVRDQVLVYVAKGLILERQNINEETQRMIDKAILQERGNIQA
ncbi:hypothetical protein Tco_1505422 [Tanacetum coccineum]